MLDRRLRPPPAPLSGATWLRAHRAAGELGADRAAAGSDAQPAWCNATPDLARRRTPRRTDRRPPSAEQRPRRRLALARRSRRSDATPTTRAAS
ncbi:hypothetical protein ACPA9J_16555 [Pseudomonas aeruginosa]